MKRKLTIAFALILLAVAGQAIADHCRQRVVVRQQYAYPPHQVSYFVGPQIRAEAQVEAQKRADPEWQEFQRFKAFKRYQQDHASQPAAPAAPVAPAPPAIASTILQAKCAKCHSGNTPKGGLILDGTAPLTCEQILSALKRARLGEMPPKAPLSGEEVGTLIDELLFPLSPSEVNDEPGS